jgi:hypothetical protein
MTTNRDRAADVAERIMETGGTVRVIAEALAAAEQRGYARCQAERGALVHVTPDEAAAWLRAEMPFVHVSVEDRRAWERVDSAIRSAMSFRAANLAAQDGGSDDEA